MAKRRMNNYGMDEKLRKECKATGRMNSYGKNE
jgi:hypothetical protein